jgi:hypothetical protein
MIFHPLRAREKKEKELAEDRVPDTEALLAEDIKDRNHAREGDRDQDLRVVRCLCREGFQSVVLLIYSGNNSAL